MCMRFFLCKFYFPCVGKEYQILLIIEGIFPHCWVGIFFFYVYEFVHILVYVKILTIKEMSIR